MEGQPWLSSSSMAGHGEVTGEGKEGEGEERRAQAAGLEE
jgi:hypothetical protein